MARKSRKHIENPNVPARPLALRTAAYLRISETKPELPPELLNDLTEHSGYAQIVSINPPNVLCQADTGCRHCSDRNQQRDQ